MIFVDDETKPLINGTGSEDYFLGSWDFAAAMARSLSATKCTARR